MLEPPTDAHSTIVNVASRTSRAVPASIVIRIT
jgi:hypothetical protein